MSNLEQKIKNVLDEIKNANEKNFEFIGEPEPYEITDQVNFTYYAGFGRIEPDEDSTPEQIREATLSALKDILSGELLNVADKMYFEIDWHERIFDRNEWSEACLNMADACLAELDKDWEEEWRREIERDIADKFGERCEWIASFDELAEAYDERCAQIFEDWFCEQMDVSPSKWEDSDMFDDCWDYISTHYADALFSVCVPENIQRRKNVPLHNCVIHEIENKKGI